MTLLAFAVLLFIAIHLTAALPALKAPLKARLGKAYGPAFGTASLFALALVVAGWANRDFVPVYDPPAWGRHVTFALVLLAFISIGFWLFRGSFRQTLRFPFAIAAMCWGAGHLFVRGDAASLILFGGMALYGALHYAIAAGNGVKPDPVVRGGHNLMSVLFGIAFYGIAAQLHGIIIGVPVITLVK